jgi:glycosyltransferase 2 family protein
MPSILTTKISRRFYKIFILFILIGFIAWHKDISKIVAYFNLRLFVCMLLIQPIHLASIAMLAIRLSILVRKPRTPFFTTFKAVMLSIGMNNLLPARIAELFKVAYLREHGGIPTSAGLAGIFLERMADFIFLGVLALLGVGLFLVDVRHSILLVVLMVVTIGVLVFIRDLERFIFHIASRIPWVKFRRFCERFLGYALVRLKGGGFYSAMLFGFGAWGFSFVTVALFLHLAGGISLGLIGTFGVYLAIVIGRSVPVLPGSFGTYEAAAVLALKGFGYHFEEALALALALHVAQIAIALIYSLEIAIIEHTGFSTLSREVFEVVRNKSAER